MLNESKDDHGYFSQKLIPFGNDGGGNYMCFDYHEHKANNPPIIYWNHSIYENSKKSLLSQKISKNL
ncbi:MAG: SMI1/KNR4 family protein [Alphaproteobacteria bacterium]|nr:SMI1/KNR4 family protein [Alphaproteobacteria bacterium]